MNLNETNSWFGEFSIEVFGINERCSGILEYGLNTGFWLRIMLADNSQIAKKCKQNPLARSLYSISQITGLVSNLKSLEKQEITVFARFDRQCWGEDISNIKNVGGLQIPDTRLDFLIFQVDVCLFGKKHFLKDGNITQANIKYNSAVEDFFIPSSNTNYFGGETWHPNIDIKLNEGKHFKILNTKSGMPLSKRLIKDFFFSRQESFIQELDKICQKIIDQHKETLFSIQKQEENSIFSYLKPVKLEVVLKDIKILTDYYCLMLANYTASPSEITLHTKDNSTFTVLFMIPGMEIKSPRATTDKVGLPNMLTRRPLLMEDNALFAGLKTFIEKYEEFEHLLFILKENRYIPSRFSTLYLSRIIDILKEVGKKANAPKSREYSYCIDAFLKNNPQIKKQIEKILQPIPINKGKDVIGEQLSERRARIVHFSNNGRVAIPIKQLEELYKYLELIAIDYIFSIIGISEEFRNAIKLEEERYI